MGCPWCSARSATECSWASGITPCLSILRLFLSLRCSRWSSRFCLRKAYSTLWGLVWQGWEVAQQQVPDQILQPYAFEELVVVDVEVLAYIEEHFGRVVHEHLADLLYRFLVALVDKFVVVLAVQVLLVKLEKLVKFVVVRFQTPPHPCVSHHLPSIMFSIMFQFSCPK